MKFRSFSLAIVLSILGLGVAQAQNFPRVTIETTPPGAKVYIDGKNNGMACQSGPTCKPRMLRGPHRLFLELDGYQLLEETVNITAAQRFAFTLRPLPAKLDIKTLATNTNGRGAELFIDGALLGTVPTVVEVTTGKHLVEVRRPGFLPYIETVDARGAETSAVFVALNAEPEVGPTTGSLMASSPLAGAEVVVDDQPRGPVPVLVDNLAPGDHVVEIRGADAAIPPFRRTVHVTAGQQSSVHAIFAPIAPTSGGVLVSSPVTGAEVVVDAQARGPVPVLVENLLPGDHLVEVRDPDGGSLPWRRNVRIVAGQQTAVSATLIPTAQATPPPPPPPPPLPRIAVVPRNTDISYVVTTTSGSESCATPCMLPLPPGPAVINVQGPGRKLFTAQIEVPSAPAQITVQHFTKSRVIAGVILTVLAIPADTFGALLLVRANQQSMASSELLWGGIIGAHGLAFTIAALAELSSIRGNRAEVALLGPRMASSTPEAAPRSVDLALRPSPTEATPLAGLSIAY